MKRKKKMVQAANDNNNNNINEETSSSSNNNSNQAKKSRKEFGMPHVAKEQKKINASSPSQQQQQQQQHDTNNNNTSQKKRNKNALPQYPFEVDYCDHFETRLECYRDVLGVLDEIASCLGKTRSSLQIYDPYYCNGGVIKNLGSLGFNNVYNKCEDFYKVAAKNQVENFDVLVTNPPYSGDHKEKILQLCEQHPQLCTKPILLLMPNYIAVKNYFQSQSSSYFYIVPKQKYEYNHPEGTGHASSPFFSLWYVYLPQSIDTPAVRKRIREQLQSTTGCKMVETVDGLKNIGATPAQRRPNPKARKRMKQQQQQQQQR